LHHAISPFSELHNNHLIPILAFIFEGKEMYPIFVFAVLLVNSLHSGKAW